ncbi:prophage ps1 protein 16 [Streptococcus pyogenes JRS4]|nr:prophage ps1 protein 16 [Streptococcus pyogenes A20]AMY96573.1 Hypothetical protein AUQ45_0004 [Streptococcus pyogenes]EFM34397.1 hypothetical protein HMPREF0841_0020 [Streptococcus pyogenes ATCC 10782]EQL80998.1 hypothetical protein HMPREF1226_1484 [Streptococcus pyogenes UTMEM-1]ESU86413.1 hypothetical protein HMPREF1241_0493 [Streptococcus pyogenes GA03799]ESU87195.1 hypothetical protein HMPREF1242_1352 [Streptococcus pyogenes GA40884]ESU88902.1 hypothetical protein HMPREF1240_0880 [Str
MNKKKISDLLIIMPLFHLHLNYQSLVYYSHFDIVCRETK